MKKEITTLLNSEDATLKINKFCILRRWTKNWCGYDVDCLVAEFSITHAFSHRCEIKARDWRGIVEEVLEAQTEAFTKAMNECNKNLKHGYLG